MIPVHPRRDPLVLRQHCEQHGLAALLVAVGVGSCFFGAVEVGLAVVALAGVGAVLGREGSERA